MDTERFEDYPISSVILSNLVSFSIYGIGAYVLWKLYPLAAVAFLGYCAFLEFRVLRHSCANCYYYGRVCCFGKGRVCSILFKKGDPQKFIDRRISWLDILPDFLVTIIPALGGIVLLIEEFSWIILVLLLMLLVLGFGGSGVIRGSFACNHCAQRELGCPALELFDKKRNSGRPEKVDTETAT